MHDAKVTQTKAAFTPGPWTAAGIGDHIFAEGNPYGHGAMMVAQVRGWGHLTGTGGGCAMKENDAIAIQEANARLIAAAPELLAALKALDADGGFRPERENYVPGPAGAEAHSIACKLWRDAKAAIAKATGGAQ